MHHLPCWKGTKIWKSVKSSDILSRCPSKWWHILFLSLFLSLSHIMVSWEEGSENNFALALTPTSRLLAVEAPPSQLYVVEWRRSTVNSVKLWISSTRTSPIELVMLRIHGLVHTDIYQTSTSHGEPSIHSSVLEAPLRLPRTWGGCDRLIRCLVYVRMD